MSSHQKRTSRSATYEKPLLSIMLKHHKRITSTVEIRQKWDASILCYIQQHPNGFVPKIPAKTTQTNHLQPLFLGCSLFRLFHVVSPQLHVALGVNPTPNSEARDEHQSIPNYKAPASCERMIPVSGREPRGWDHPMGESDQWFEPKKLKEVGVGMISRISKR